MTNPTTPEDKIDEVIDAHLNELKAGHDGKLKVALLALLNEARAEEFSHYWREFERHHIWDSSEIVDVLTKRNISNAATPKEE